MPAPLPVLIAVLLLLTACAPEDYPGDPRAPASTDAPAARIGPMAPLVAQLRPAPPAVPDPALQARGDDMRHRAAVAPDKTTADDLERRGADLRRRADGIRTQAAP
ncbi:MAG: hypothetical protein ACK5IB_13840 [Qingshengfaniella sp.]